MVPVAATLVIAQLGLSPLLSTMEFPYLILPPRASSAGFSADRESTSLRDPEESTGAVSRENPASGATRRRHVTDGAIVNVSRETIGAVVDGVHPNVDRIVQFDPERRVTPE